MYTHKTSDTYRKTQHYDGIQDTDVYAKLKSIGSDDTKQLTEKCFMLYTTAILSVST
jgi:hypothetical protein